MVKHCVELSHFNGNYILTKDILFYSLILAMIKIYGYICQNLNAQNLSTFEFLAGRYMVMTYDQYSETPICGHPSNNDSRFCHQSLDFS